MELQVNPHELILIGENSFIRLSEDGGKTQSTRCSHWRVLWSPAGSGYALFVDSPITNGVRIYGDNAALVRFLQKEIEYLLHKPFSDPATPIVEAMFDRDGVPPGVSSELAQADGVEIRMSWSNFLKPFNFSAPPGFDKRPIGVQTTFFPAQWAQFSIGDVRAPGAPWQADRGGKPCTTACLAWCETWFRP